MAFKTIIYSLAFCAVFVYGEDTKTENYDFELSAQEGRALIEVPIIGSVLYIASSIFGLIWSIKSVLLQFKLSLLGLILSVPSWLYQNCFPVIMATLAVIGYCGMTSVTSWFTPAPVEEYEIHHPLFYAARSLENANNKYGQLQ